MAKGPVHVSDGDATFDNTSRIKPKRSHNCDRNISPVEAADDMRRRGIDDNFSEDASVGMICISQLLLLPTIRPLSSFDPSLCQSSNPTLEGTPGNHLAVPIAGSVANATPTSKLRPESTSRTKPEFKPSKKEAPNSFPSNDRHLIMTGMLDGLTVKYISLSWEVTGSFLLLFFVLPFYLMLLSMYDWNGFPNPVFHRYELGPLIMAIFSIVGPKQCENPPNPSQHQEVEDKNLLRIALKAQLALGPFLDSLFPHFSITTSRFGRSKLLALNNQNHIDSDPS
ncbi:hypothetical protein V6N12_039668 [Hibiscus sabdariffa]|uniref:Uncharacterized protein n=1 Tax=Hibiscus sabdariffa TaxID=183260 RepID=A0ABR2E1F7_9ROSI